jgi:hypothetical protein
MCDAILSYGVFDTNDSYSTRDRYRLTQAAVCSSSFDSLQKAQSAKGSLGLDIFEVLGLNAAGSYNEQTYHTAWSTFCAQSYDENSANDVVINHVKQASSVIASAWTACIQAVQNGFVYYVTPSVDRLRFAVILQNKGDGDTHFHVNKITFTPPLAQGSCQGLPDHLPYPTSVNFFTFSCVKPADVAVLVGVETDRGFVPQVEVPSRTDVPLSL